MVDRDRKLNVRLTQTEAERLAALAEETGVSQSGLVRQWIRREYERVFGPVSKPKKTK